jgi:hypothetical protein
MYSAVAVSTYKQKNYDDGFLMRISLPFLPPPLISRSAFEMFLQDLIDLQMYDEASRIAKQWKNITNP